MLVIAAVVSFILTYFPELQIVGIISAKIGTNLALKSGAFSEHEYFLFKSFTDTYFKKRSPFLLLYLFIVFAVIVFGYFLGKDIFYGSIIGVVISFIFARSKEKDLNDEFFDTFDRALKITKDYYLSHDNLANNSEQNAESTTCNNYCRKCGAPLSKDSAFCNKCGEKIISIEECENELS